jgi:hypothetical protein
MLIVFIATRFLNAQHFINNQAETQVGSLALYGRAVADAAAEYASSRANSTPAGTNASLTWAQLAATRNGRPLSSVPPSGTAVSAWVVRSSNILTVYVRIQTDKVGMNRTNVVTDAVTKIGGRAAFYDGAGGIVRNTAGVWTLAPSALPAFGAQPGDLIIRAYGQVG